jgi:Fe-S-cluster containining protein
MKPKQLPGSTVVLGERESLRATELPAGDFSAWLRAMRAALAGGAGMEVACGDCVGCCTSSYFIKVRAHEEVALSRIGPRHLEPVPGGKGAMLMGYDAHGHCLMFANGGCSIYQDRPETCRTYDCRIFSAAGMKAGGDDKAVINERVTRWRFSFPTDQDRAEQRAVAAAASFLRQHPVRFPGGHVPSRPSEIAVLAVKTFAVFMRAAARDNEIAAAIVDTALEFDRAAEQARG